MSLKKIAASTPCRRTGRRVISKPFPGRGRRRALPFRPQLSVLRKGSTGLPHEPHWRAVHGPACIARTRRLLAVSAAVQG